MIGEALNMGVKNVNRADLIIWRRNGIAEKQKLLEEWFRADDQIPHRFETVS
jgi:hypothetical protein